MACRQNMSVKANRAGALMMSPALRNPTPNSLHPSSSKGDPSRWLNCPPTAWAVVKRLSAWAASRATGNPHGAELVGELREHGDVLGPVRAEVAAVDLRYALLDAGVEQRRLLGRPRVLAVHDRAFVEHALHLAHEVLRLVGHRLLRVLDLVDVDRHGVEVVLRTGPDLEPPPPEHLHERLVGEPGDAM